MDATTQGRAPVPDGVYTREAKSREERQGRHDPCVYLKRVKHLFSRGYACFAAECESSVDTHTVHSLCLTRRHRECSLFKAHEVEQRRRHKERQGGHA